MRLAAVIDAPLALALTTGVVAAFNPCGFAMLPAYLSYFVGATGEDHPPSTSARLARAALVGSAVTGGFVVVFATIGFVVSQISSAVYRVIPWVTSVVGVVLVVLGVAMLRGYEPAIGLPKVKSARSGSDLRAMFTYGISYAVVSLGCSLTPFLGIVASGFRRADPVAGVALFVTYALGMGLVVVTMSMAVALTQQTFIRAMRRVLPFVQRASGVLLVVAGAYVTYYGWYSRRILSGGTTTVRGGSVVDRVTGWSASLSTVVQQNLGGGVLIVALVVVVTVVVLLLVSTRRSRTSEPVTSGPIDSMPT